MADSGESNSSGRISRSPRSRRLRALLLRWRRSRRAVRRFIVHNLLHADDPPRKIALGVGIGFFVALTPTVGLQMVLVVFGAWLLRANKVVGLPIVWISNPATVVPIFYGCYHVGRFLLGIEAIDEAWWSELAHPEGQGWVRAAFFWHRLMDIATPLWVGSLVVACIAGYISYYTVLTLVSRYRMRKWGQLTPP